MTVPKEKILEVFQQSRESQMKAKHLSRLLGLNIGQRRHLRESLDRLVREGQLEKLRGGRFKLVGEKGDSKPMMDSQSSRSAKQGRTAKVSSAIRLTGRLITHRDGYGFVELDAPTLPSHTANGKRVLHSRSASRAGAKPTLPYSDTRPAGSLPQISGDIFIPPFQMRDALNGDRVMVEIDAIKRDGRAEGRVVKVLERKFASMVGQFKRRGSTAVVLPMDNKFLHQVIIEPGEEGAAQDGDVVDVEITRFPTPLESPRGRVTEVLGKPGDFGIDVEIVIRKHHLPLRFPEEVQEAARRIPSHVLPEEVARREDFRNLPIVTIDGETAKDFDDAVYVERLSNGHYELQVHIADVSHYVQPGTPLDEEALLRGTSVYFPNRAVPMLPEELSNGICSLKPRVDRLVQSCIMEIDAQGKVVAHRFAQGVIRSVERMTYTHVAKILVDRDPAMMERYAPLVDRFRLMEELALILNRMREGRGSIDFDLPEPLITFDENGLMTGVVRSERNIAHRLIEEFMLIANETVARKLFELNIPSLYRVHELPNPTKVAEFEMIARSFGHTLGIDLIVKKLPVEKESRQRDRRGHNSRSQRSDRGATGFAGSSLWLQATDLQITPRDYQRLVTQIEGKPEERILSYLMLRSLKQARYCEQNLGHFGLASTCYTHFTSPIRRYPDLIVHRILKSLLTKPGTTHYSNEQLAVIGNESSETERRADGAERELIEWKKAKFMQERIGDEFEGLIISVNKNGFYVELMDLFVEGFVPVAALMDDFYVYRENMQCLVGDRTKRKFRIGDRLRVMVDRVDADSHKIQFLVSDLLGSPGARRGGKTTGRKKGRQGR